MNDLYRDILLDHYNHSRSRGTLECADFTSEGNNPSCGDTVIFQGCVTAEELVLVAFTGSGCVISQAAASLLCEKVLGQKLKSIKALDKEALITMLGMELGPVRLKCALLPLVSLQEGIVDYQNREGSAGA